MERRRREDTKRKKGGGPERIEKRDIGIEEI